MKLEKYEKICYLYDKYKFTDIKIIVDWYYYYDETHIDMLSGYYSMEDYEISSAELMNFITDIYRDDAFVKYVKVSEELFIGNNNEGQYIYFFYDPKSIFLDNENLFLFLSTFIIDYYK